MATKETDTCLQKAAPTEPIFVLRAQDQTAPDLVREWARRAEALGTPAAKVTEARELAVRMERWPTRKVPD
jgi:hypothetical protein